MTVLRDDRAAPIALSINEPMLDVRDATTGESAILEPLLNEPPNERVHRATHSRLRPGRLSIRVIAGIIGATDKCDVIGLSHTLPTSPGYYRRRRSLPICQPRRIMLMPSRKTCVPRTIRNPATPSASSESV